ncbi:MAG: winged helix-turn-helix transcriptional regulator [Burkholderiaceae bacterium]|nr:winged helix-turn-helix transcriptional regulator [Ideonella sp.]MCC7287607.1 winged helix-turn-helix transcriptional regulator [Burkholderiaceae bacterium]
MRESVDHVNQMAGDDVVEAIHAVMHLFRARQYRAVRDGASELTHLEGRVLAFFARHPGATQRELAAHSGRDKGQLARLVAGLKARALLQAQVDEGDRRSVRLRLTARGQALQQALRRQSRQLSKAAVAGLTEPERRALVELLRKVRVNIEAAG